MGSLDAPSIRLDGGTGWATGLLHGDRVLRCDGETLLTTLRIGGAVHRRWDDPIAALRWLGEEAGGEPEGARWIGYVGYGVGRLFERFAEDRRGNDGGPLFCFTRVGVGASAGGGREAADMPDESGTPEHVVARAGVTRETYLAMVQRALEYVRAGDVFQVNLSQRFTLPFEGNAWILAERLRRETPAAYGGCLDFGDHAIVSNSPELFFQVDADQTIRTRPIKGTRPRAAGAQATAELAMHRELLHSEKDAAELNMIVDLERNDLGRICQLGSVRVEQPRTIEAHPTVYHGVATVGGKLRVEIGFVEILRAMFPGGSVTGAPKIRAMQIIDELEPVRRGPYCGAMGWLAMGGQMMFNVAIRTIVIRDAVASFSVGGGIVADSDAAAEFDETMVKARAMLGGLNARVG